MDFVAVQQCGNLQQYERQCVAVRTAVCGSALGSVWQCARRYAALLQCGSVQQCAAVRAATFVRQCARRYAAVCRPVCGSGWQ
jgi:hypothetical protein